MAYSSSFTAGGILHNEFEAILPFLLQPGINEFLMQEAKDNIYLKIKTESARKRVVTELKKRIEKVDIHFWETYSASNEAEKKMLLFYLCCTTYQLVTDFHFKVTVAGYWTFTYEVDPFGYKMLLDELASKDETVHGWSDSTRKKCITNYVRMLKEAGLISSNKIQKPILENSFYCYFISQQQTWALDIFLLNNLEKETIINYCR